MMKRIKQALWATMALLDAALLLFSVAYLISEGVPALHEATDAIVPEVIILKS